MSPDLSPAPVPSSENLPSSLPCSPPAPVQPQILATLIRDLPGMVYRCANDRNWTMLFVSAGCRELTGYDTAEIEQNRAIAYGDLVHPEDRDAVWAKCQASLDARTPCENEYRIIDRAGKTRWVHERAAGEYAPDGKLIAIDGFIQDITARKAAEATLRTRDTQLTSLIQSVDGIVWEADAATFQFTFVSARAERLLGYPLSRWLKEPTFWADHLHPEDREHTVHYCASCTQASRDHEFEYRFLAADGRVVWLRDIVTVVTENNRPVTLRGLMVDITAQKATDTSLAQTLRALADAQRIASVGSWRLDVASNQFFWTEELFRMYGLDPAQPVPSYTESAKLFTPESWKLLSDAIAHCQATGTAYELELETVRPDGRRGWMLARGERVQDAHGKTIELHGVAQDITARKNAESERDRLFNLSADLICVANHKGYFTQVNPAWNRTLGWTEAEMTGRPWLEFVHPEDFSASDNAGRELVDGQTVLRFENRYRHRDGSYRWLQWNAFPLPEIKTLFGIARDITTQKLAEGKIKAQLTELRRWQNVTMDREDRVLELKREVNTLLKNAGQPPRYGSAEQ